jgi:choice-of-anchor B domain-containing protein
MHSGPRTLVWSAALAVGLAASAHEIDPEAQIEESAAVLSDLHCHDGHAGSFACRNVDLLSWVPPGVFGLGHGNDIWGWTDPRTRDEYALLGLRDGVAFVDVSEPHHPVYVGVLPTQTHGSTWRDIKVYRDHAFVVSEASGHGMQVFDLRQLDDVVEKPAAFAPTAHYALFSSAHNVVIDEEAGFAYAVGTNTCGAGLHMVDIRRPTEPVFAGCYGGDGYTHDAQCVVYHGPDAEHRGREICFNANEDTLTIVDVTEKTAPRMLARRSYAGRGYTHQGWLTEDHAWFFVDDELDEFFRGHGSRTYVWDVSDLDAPRVVGNHTGLLRSIDHNLYVVANHVFEANYTSGLRILRTGDLRVPEMVEVASFDTFPASDGGAFQGAWSVYPFFESGVVIVSDINRGLFVLEPHLDAVPECSDGLDNDLDGLRDYPDDLTCAGPETGMEQPRTDVAIDVEPHDPDNVVRPWRHGVGPVAILGSDTFDVADVDPDTLAYGPDGARPLHGFGSRIRDVDRDGFDDLIAFYWIQQTGIDVGDRIACLRWQTRAATPYEGCDAVQVLPPPARVQRRR